MGSKCPYLANTLNTGFRKAAVYARAFSGSLKHGKIPNHCVPIFTPGIPEMLYLLTLLLAAALGWLLWQERKTEQEWLEELKELRAKIPTVDVTPQLMVTGAVDLLNEVSTTKITGEEDIFSKTDLFDFTANIEGAEKIFELFKPALEAKDKKLAGEIEAQFKAVNTLLDKHNKAKDGSYDYAGYDTLSKDEIKALAEAVNKLGEPLAQMGDIIE